MTKKTDPNPQEEAKKGDQNKDAQKKIAPVEEEKIDVSKYKLEEGDYKLQIRILEATELVPKATSALFGDKNGSANPFVKITVLGQEKESKIQKLTLNPTFNERFFFDFPKLTKAELEEGTVVFTVYDYNNMFQAPSIIGAFEIDLTSIYFSPNHELFRTTLMLVDPEEETFSQTTGMLRVTTEFLGPKDEPNIHDVAYSKKNAQEKVLKPLKLKPTGHCVDIKIWRAEHLPITDDYGEGIDAYIKVRYAGNYKDTKDISSLNPEWNQNIKIACVLPNQSKAVNFELWDKDLFSKDDLVGTFKVDFKSFQDKMLEPKWANLYGPPPSADNEFAEKMTLYGYDQGSYYRGRVLYSIGSYNDPHPKSNVSDIKISFPDNPKPNAPSKTYLFRVDIIGANDLPPRENCIVSVSIGPYLLKSEPVKIENGTCEIYQQLEDKRVNLPVNADEMPDIFVYFQDEAKIDRRHSFIRLKAKDFLNPSDDAVKTFKLKEDKSLDLVTDEEFPGIIYARIQLFGSNPPERRPLNHHQTEKLKYQMRCYIYVARNLPAADKEGTSDPFVTVKCAGKQGRTETRENTLNPGFFECVTIDNLELRDLRKEVDMPVGLSVCVYDADTHDNADVESDQLIGRSYITVKRKWTKYTHIETKKAYDVVYRRPKWHNIIYDVTDKKQGEILLSYALIPMEYAQEIPFEEVYPNSVQKALHFFVIGVRDVNLDALGFTQPKYLSIDLDVSGDKTQATTTDKIKIHDGGINTNKYTEVKFDVPYSRPLAPLLDVHLNAWYKDDHSELIGYCSIDIGDELKEFYRNIKMGESIQTQYGTQKIGGKKPEKDIQQTKAIEEEKKEEEITSTKRLTNSHPQPTEIGTFRIQKESFFSQSEWDDNAIEMNDIQINMTANKKLQKELTDEEKKKMEEKNKGIKAKRKGLIESIFDKKNEIKYEDYDTDENEDLDVTPEWMKGRDVKLDELEDFIADDNKIKTIEITHGSSRASDKQGMLEAIVGEEIGIKTMGFLKTIFLDSGAQMEREINLFKKKMQPKPHIVRVYILDALNIIDPEEQDPPTTYIKVKMGDKHISLEDTSLCKDTTEPEYYCSQDFQVEMPGISFLTIEVWLKHEVMVDKLLSQTRIDVEQRHFNKAWHDYSDKKPVEYRALWTKQNITTPGRIATWVECFSAKKRVKQYNIAPFERVKCELRVIVWDCLDFVHDDELTDASDLFVRGGIKGKEERYETDTAWRSRGKASFNWRWKIPVTLPITAKDLDCDKLMVQLYDRDIITSNTMLGEAFIDLNQHKLLDKVYKRRRGGKIKYKVYDKQKKEKIETEKIYYHVYGNDVDSKGNKISKGRVSMTIELLTEEEAKKNENAQGRDAPNNFPALPDPPGRLSFDITSPLKMLKELMGPKLYRKMCFWIWCVMCCIIIIAVGYYIGTSAAGNVVCC